MSYVLIGLALAVAAGAIVVAGFPAIARGWAGAAIRRGSAMRTFLIVVALVLGPLLVVGLIGALDPMRDLSNNDAVINLIRPFLALGLLLIAWALLRPVVVGFLRGLRRDITGEDEGPPAHQ